MAGRWLEDGWKIAGRQERSQRQDDHRDVGHALSTLEAIGITMPLDKGVRMPLSEKMRQDIIDGLRQDNFYILPMVVAGEVRAFRENIPEIIDAFGWQCIDADSLDTFQICDGEISVYVLFGTVNKANPATVVAVTKGVIARIRATDPRT